LAQFLIDKAAKFDCVRGYRTMKSRDGILRLKRFAASETARKVADLEGMIREFQQMASDLERQIASEEDRTGVRDQAHFAYSTFAKAAAQRREKLLASVVELEEKLRVASREHEDAREALAKLESQEPRSLERSGRRSKPDRSSRAAVG